MPIIQFNLMEGRTVEQKRRLAEKVTDTVVEVLGVKRETVRILIHELGMHDFSVGGVTAADRLASNGLHSSGATAPVLETVNKQ